MTSTNARRIVEARCPLRPGEACSLCQVDVTGPADCGLVYLVMADEELRELRRASRGNADPLGEGLTKRVGPVAVG